MRTLKPYGIVMLAAILLAPGSLTAAASWLIDVGRFHASPHGRLSCLDCHDPISSRQMHPDPADVSKSLADFFDPESCLACHPDIPDRLSEGVHGSKKIDSPENYQACLSCHDPHTLDATEQGKPVSETCGDCHEPKAKLPGFSPGDEACLGCHRLVDPADPEATLPIFKLCFHCHGSGGGRAQELTGRKVSLLDDRAYARTPHADLNCMACHPRAARFPHNAQNQDQTDCRSCHTRHTEGKIHDAHAAVSCQACHLDGRAPSRDPETGAVRAEKTGGLAGISRVHHMDLHQNRAGNGSMDKRGCGRCHFSKNPLGASAMILPAKGILCMPCHAATGSLGDAPMVVALLVFLAGMAMAASVWLSGSLPGKSEAAWPAKIAALARGSVDTLFSKQFSRIARALVYDVLLQRRLFRRSPKRWFIHGLIFFPLAVRFLYGIAGLMASILVPGRDFTWTMLDKNHPITAFFFDFTGILMLLGLGLAFQPRSSNRAPLPGLGDNAAPDRPAAVKPTPGLPEHDWWALGLIAGIVTVGFFLEAMRIAMTGWPPNSGWAVVGYGLSMLFAGMTGLTDAYGYLWYAHALLTGAFVAYIPFSRLMHMIMAPVVLLMNAANPQGARGAWIDPAPTPEAGAGSAPPARAPDGGDG